MIRLFKFLFLLIFFIHASVTATEVIPPARRGICFHFKRVIKPVIFAVLCFTAGGIYAYSKNTHDYACWNITLPPCGNCSSYYIPAICLDSTTSGDALSEIVQTLNNSGDCSTLKPDAVHVPCITCKKPNIKLHSCDQCNGSLSSGMRPYRRQCMKRP